jgi:DNA-binding MarR family transcriptional regulator
MGMYKQDLKVSEARVLVFLSQVDARHKFARQISNKLDMDYAYLLARLKVMSNRDWVQPIKRDRKVFYELKFPPLDKAIELLEKKARLLTKKQNIDE